MLAHLVQTGFGGFYDGLVHWAITPRDTLVVLSLALLAGLAGPAGARLTLVVLPLVWLAGGVLGFVHPAVGDLTLATTLTFGLAGFLVAFDPCLPRWALLLLVSAAGFLHGLANGAVMGAAGMARLALPGTVVAVFFVASVLPAVVVSLRRPAARIGVRVAGSWIAAISLLMLGWLLGVPGS